MHTRAINAHGDIYIFAISSMLHIFIWRYLYIYMQFLVCYNIFVYNLEYIIKNKLIVLEIAYLSFILIIPHFNFWIKIGLRNYFFN